MADASPDYVYELMRLERQRKGIEVTMLDQTAQIEVGKEELAALKDERKSLASREVGAEGETPASKARHVYEVAKIELAIMDVDLRTQQLKGEAEQKRTNIDASQRALGELDAQIESMKESQDGR